MYDLTPGQWGRIDWAVSNYKHSMSPPPHVSISGPTCVDFDRSGTWVANASEGAFPYSYQWYYYADCGTGGASVQSQSGHVNDDPSILGLPCGAWTAVGGNSDSFTHYPDRDFQLKVTVTDAVSRSVTAGPYFVTYSPNSPCNGGGGTLSLRESADKAAVGPEGEDVARESPKKVSLNQNHPNPFNPTTQISFEIPRSTHVQLLVFDALGREVARLINTSLEAGSHTVDFDAANLPSGMYFYTLRSGDLSRTNRMLLLK